jgi:hypothetical protein
VPPLLIYTIMDPDKKKKFNFGTGEIDVDQWL